MSVEDEKVRVHPCKSAEEFVDTLRPERWLSAGSTWIFRGHQDAQWSLVPKALRPDDAERMKAFVRDGYFDAPQFIEFATLQAFVRCLDRQGIVLPGERPEVRDRLRTNHFLTNHTKGMYEEDEHRDATWPSEELYQILALAQHYGVPTRLLDWTSRGFTAAYFAVAGAAEGLYEDRRKRARQDEAGGAADEEEARQDDPGDRELAVWAYNWYASQKEPVQVSADGPSEPVQQVRVPSGLNSNLAAQEGLFTLSRTMTVGGPGLEALLPPRFFQRVTLPWSEAAAALKLLHVYGVDANSVYPGIEGAATAARQYSLHPALSRVAHRVPKGR